MRIAAIVFFVYICLVLLFFSTIGGPFDNLVGVDTNEIMQDWMERNLGLKNILNGHLKKDFKVKTLYKDGVFISILNKDQLIFDKARGYSGYVHNNPFGNEAKGNKVQDRRMEILYIFCYHSTNIHIFYFLFLYAVSFVKK